MNLDRDPFERHPGAKIMRTCGICVGVAILLWFILAPKLWGHGAWFPFEVRALVSDLKVRWSSPGLAFEGWTSLYWLTPAFTLVIAYVATWWPLRREDVLLEHRMLIQKRRVEHAERIQEAERLWDEFEETEALGSTEEQIQLLERYNETANWVELGSDEKQNRVERCLALAERVGKERPQLGLRLLEQAKALRRSGKGMKASVARLMAPGIAAYVGTILALLVSTPVVAFLLLGVVGIVVMILKIILSILMVIAVIAVVIAFMKR